MQLETMYSTIDGPVATLTLNRPDVLNAANEQWARDLTTLADDLAGRPELRVVIVRGAGRAFCSGIDLTALSAGQIGLSFFRNWETGLRTIETLDAVVIAAVQSHCIGGGLQIALACDLRVARADARFGITAVKEGIIPGMGMWRIARYAGMGRAKRLALTAETIDAGVACDWGLVDYVVDEGAFESKVGELTAQVLSMGATSTRLTKRLANAVFDTPFEAFLESYIAFQQQSLASAEHKQAMIERRAERASRQG